MKENKRKCFKCGSSPAEDPETTLFRFPKPGSSNVLRCELWAKYCFPDKLWSSKDFQLKLYLEHRMLCHRHFKESAFVDFSSKQLRRFAYPDVEVTAMAKQVKRKFEMRCCVPLCKNDAENVPRTGDISFHMFPDSPELRRLWLESLDLYDWHERNETAVSGAVVCSEHFSCSDLYYTKSGFRKLRAGAVPVVIQDSLEDEEILTLDEEPLQICRICLATDCKFISMSQYKLDEAYQNLTGFMMSEDDRLSQTFCPECAQRLMNHDKFREKSLRAELLLTDLLKKTHSSIKNEILNVERKNFGLTSNLVKQVINYGLYDLYIQENTQYDMNVDFDNNETEHKVKSRVEMDKLTVLLDAHERYKPEEKINTNKQTPKPNVPSNNHNTNAQNRSRATTNIHKLARITPAFCKPPVKQYVNTRIKSNIGKLNKPNEMPKVEILEDIPDFENQVEVKQEVDSDDMEQDVQIDYIPVIDVVIDKKFKIVKKEELMQKNAQLIIGNKKIMPILQEVEMNKAIVKNKHNIPIGVDHNVINKMTQTNQQWEPQTNQRNVAVHKNRQSRNRGSVGTTINNNQGVLPVMVGDRIIMPNVENDNEQIKTPQTTNTKKSQDDMPILQNILTNRSPIRTKPIKLLTVQKTIPVDQNKLKNIQMTAEKRKSVPTEINIPEEVLTVEEGQMDTDEKYEVVVPVVNYEEHEYYEESVVETVHEDYLESQSEEESEFDNIKREVEKIVKEEKRTSAPSFTEGTVEETYTEKHIPESDAMKGHDDNNETWDENNEDNDDNWEPDDYSEDQDNENDHISDDADIDESTYNFKSGGKTHGNAVRRAKHSRKRKSALLNYGKPYFYDDLNDVIFTIQPLSLEEQLVEIRKRQETTYKDATYSCKLCYRGFMHKYAYDRHMSLHASDVGDFECEVCKFKFRSVKLLEAHQASRHATKFSCNLCEFTTTSNEPARQHGMKHRGIKYQCPHCSEEGIRYTVLMDHIAIVHSPESLCTVCGLKLVSDEDLERHKEVRHSNDLVDWDNATLCDTCKILFANEDAYRLHLGVSIKHDSEFIEEHLRAKSNELEEFTKCSSQYKKQVYTGPLTCEQCGLKLPTLRKYHAHFRRDHPDKTRTFYPTMKKKVMCELCGRFFKAQWQYIEHLRLHTNERPFSCEHCGKAFITNRLLCAHRYVHGVGRARPDIKCKLCGKTFANKGNLHRHMGVHTDEKRFKCEICNTAYRQKAEMKSHYEHVHLRKPWPKRHRPKRDESRSKSVVTSEDDSTQAHTQNLKKKLLKKWKMNVKE